MVTPVDVSYSAASGATLYGGMPSPGVTGALGVLIAAMSANTIAQVSGTNINAMVNFEGTDYGMLEGNAPYLIPQWAGKWWYDATQGIIGGVGTPQGFLSSTPVGVHTKAVYFDLKLPLASGFTCFTNPTGTNDGHIYDGNVSGAMGGYVYRRSIGDTHIRRARSQDKGAFSTAFTLTGTHAGDTTGALEIFPAMGAQGSIFFVGDLGDYCTYDIATGVQSSWGHVTGTAGYAFANYVDALQCIVFGAGVNATKIYKMTSAGVVSEIVHTPPTGIQIACYAGSDPVCGGPVLPHPGGGSSIIVMSHALNAAWSLDIPTGVWTKLIDFPSGLLNKMATAAVGIPLRGLGAIAIFISQGRTSPPNPVTQCSFWLFKV